MFVEAKRGRHGYMENDDGYFFMMTNSSVADVNGDEMVGCFSNAFYGCMDI